jgi:hypothetical protein
LGELIWGLKDGRVFKSDFPFFILELLSARISGSNLSISLSARFIADDESGNKRANFFGSPSQSTAWITDSTPLALAERSGCLNASCIRSTSRSSFDLIDVIKLGTILEI